MERKYRKKELRAIVVRIGDAVPRNTAIFRPLLFRTERSFSELGLEIGGVFYFAVAVDGGFGERLHIVTHGRSGGRAVGAVLGRFSREAVGAAPHLGGVAVDGAPTIGPFGVGGGDAVIAAPVLAHRTRAVERAEPEIGALCRRARPLPGVLFEGDPHDGQGDDEYQKGHYED